MTGVVSLSGAVRSMTWMPPSWIAVVRSVSRDMAGGSCLRCRLAGAAGMPPRPTKRRGQHAGRHRLKSCVLDRVAVLHQSRRGRRVRESCYGHNMTEKKAVLNVTVDESLAE